MSITFNFDEVFEIAEQIERDGARFYRSAADKFSDSTARDKLLELAAMEDKHEKTFAAIRSELKKPIVFKTLYLFQWDRQSCRLHRCMH